MITEMKVTEIGNTYILEREQWKGNKACISKAPELLEEVLKYTWTYTGGIHPYLRSSTKKVSLHEFVLGFIYGDEYVKEMINAKNIIEHLDNNGLNCTYENLHILSADMNKAKAFSIDKMNREPEDEALISTFVTDIYYCHTEKYFQMQIFMNEDIYFNTSTGRAAEMFTCRYGKFEDLYIDWFYILNCKHKSIFDIEKFHATIIYCKERPYIEISPEERNVPIIERNGVHYLNLDAKTSDGKAMTCIKHTALRSFEEDGQNN